MFDLIKDWYRPVKTYMSRYRPQIKFTKNVVLLIITLVLLIMFFMLLGFVFLTLIPIMILLIIIGAISKVLIKFKDSIYKGVLCR